jgi:hypothetical protein
MTTLEYETTATVLDIPTAPYLELSRPERIADNLEIRLTGHSYLPQPDNRARDWVASVTVPALRLIRLKEGPLDSFLSIGTGTGVDVLAAVELLGVTRVGITDVHDDVVESARQNIERNLRPGVALRVDSGAGDLTTPLVGRSLRYDLVYENLPNVALPKAELGEAVPDFVRRSLLELHFRALVKSRDFLTRRGSVIATIGSRFPLHFFELLGERAGYTSHFLSYSWKVQTDPEADLRRYAEQQQQGLGPFRFYRADVLRRVFAGVDIATSGKLAHDIEHELEAHRLDAVEAFVAHRLGDEIGHTVAVVRSRPI